MQWATHISCVTGAATRKACTATDSESQKFLSSTSQVTSPTPRVDDGNHGLYLSKKPCSWWCKHQAPENVICSGNAQGQTPPGCPPTQEANRITRQVAMILCRKQQDTQAIAFFYFFLLGYRIAIHSLQARKPVRTPDEPEVCRSNGLMCMQQSLFPITGRYSVLH